jgi:hypothetical protein
MNYSIDKYLKAKRASSKIEDHYILKLLEDGVDERPDAYYLMILYLITQELSKLRDQYSNQMKEENMTGSKIKVISLDLMLSSKPIVEQLLKIFDNLMYVKGNKIRTMFHSTFFEGAEEDQKQDFDDNEMKPSSGSSLQPFKALKQMGPKTVDILFHSIITFQRKISKSIFEKDFLADCQIYFLLCFVMKSMIEENFLTMKRIFLKHMIEVFGEKKRKKMKDNKGGLQKEERPKKSAFCLILKGLVIPKYDSREIKAKRAGKSDRPDLVWYNIITTMLLSELSFGLKSIPSDVKSQKINKMLLFFNSFNIDIFNPQYDLMEEIARLASFMLESSSVLAESLLDLKRPDKVHPGQMYSQIVQMLKLLVISFTRIAEQANSNKGQRLKVSEIERKMIIDIDKVVKNTDVLVDYYKRYTKFANHAIIKIGRLLNKIMNTLASSSSNRLFGTYMEELKKEAESIEISTSSTFHKAESKAANKKMKAFKKNKKVSKLQYDINKRFNGIVLYNFLHRISSTVEIAVGEKESIILEFAIVPEAFFISEITKNEFINNVPIGDHNAKLVNLMEFLKIFQREGFNSYQIAQKWPLLSIFSSNAAFQNTVDFIWFLTLILNGIALGTLQFSEPFDFGQWYWITLYAGSFTVIFLSLIVIILYFITKFDKSTRAKIIDDHFIKIKSEKMVARPILIWNFLMQGIENLINNHSILFICFLFILFASLSVIGYWYFLPFHLLLFAKVSQTASYIIMSIRLHSDQLLRTFLLILLLIYTSTLLVGFYFREEFRDNKNVYLCDTLMNCFIYCIDLGLRTGGGITNVMDSIAYKDSSFFPKFFLDIAHFIFINMIALSIFAGIIIDTFKELRMKLEKRSSLLSASLRNAKAVFHLRHRPKRLREGRQEFFVPPDHGTLAVELRQLHAVPRETESHGHDWNRDPGEGKDKEEEHRLDPSKLHEVPW